MNLQDKVIVITGGAQGLGLAIATRLGSLGARLALIDINQNSLDKAIEALTQQNIKAAGFVANIANESQTLEAFEKVIRHYGKLDALINNAGITRDALLVKTRDDQVVATMSLSDWQQVIDVNLTGVFLCGREAAKHMIQHKIQGVIVNISSISRHGNVGQSNYAAAKAGVAALTTTWAKELAKFGIRSAAIAPGFIETEMTAAIKPEILERIRRTIPLGAMGKPEHIAHTVQYILENDYVSGRVIEVDGALRL
jgi:3-oxoacyl-[acyl-carrier protein] reductase